MAMGRGVAGVAGAFRKAGEVPHCSSRRPARRGSTTTTTTAARDHHLRAGWDLSLATVVARGSALIPRVSLWSPSDHGKGGHDQEDKQQDGKQEFANVLVLNLKAGRWSVRWSKQH